MIDSNVVRLAVEYLDACMKRGTPATLVGMHWYIDGANKTLPLTEEVNEALAQRPTLRAQRTNDAVTFGADGPDRTVTDEDMKHADSQYRREFSAALNRIR